MSKLLQIEHFDNYYNDYFNVIDKYKDLTRHSVFCKYYNINTGLSNFNTDLNSSYTKHHNGVVYDLYYYTPLLSISQIVNGSQTDQTTTGFKFSGDGISAVIYTIKEPKISDLISIKEELFRVKEININLNSKKNSNFIQLTLEYAPLKNLNNVNIMNNYVYLISDGINVQRTKYMDYLKDIIEIENMLKGSNFDIKNELYTLDDNNIVDLNENHLIYKFLLKFRDYFSIFLKVPYGILNFNKKFGFYNLENNEYIESKGKSIKKDLIVAILNYDIRRIN
jgi:hypothetical protein